MKVKGSGPENLLASFHVAKGESVGSEISSVDAWDNPALKPDCCEDIRIVSEVDLSVISVVV